VQLLFTINFCSRDQRSPCLGGEKRRRRWAWALGREGKKREGDARLGLGGKKREGDAGLGLKEAGGGKEGNVYDHTPHTTSPRGREERIKEEKRVNK
jgi:hypothetical protein